MKTFGFGLSACFVLIGVALFGGCAGTSSSGSSGSSGSVQISFPGGSSLAMDQGQSLTINVTVTGDSSNQGVTWSCSGAACTNLTTTATSAMFTANGATGGATITATSVKEPSVSGKVTVTVNAAPATTTTQTQLTAMPATAGQPYSFTLAASGGTGTLTWSATGLSDGLTINSSTGTVSGTPTQHGSVTFTYTVKDSSGAGADSVTSGSLTITVNNPAAPTITTIQAHVPSGTAGLAYSFQFMAIGSGTLTWSATGLPSDGLSLNSSTGVVSGTPTAAQPVAFMLTVSDTFGQSSAMTPFTITVNSPAPALSITKTHTGNFVQGQQNATYTVTVSNTGTAATDGTTVTVTDTVPAGESLVTMAGNNWTCVTNSCTRSDVLQPSGSYDAITVTVNVAVNATSPQTNQASVSGGGSPTNGASDPTTVSSSCGSGSESLLSGNYAFLVKGFDNGQGTQGDSESGAEPALVGGVLTFNGTDNNGQITSGAMDMNLDPTQGGPQLNLIVTSGSYGVGSDHRGCMSITTSVGTQNYRFALNSSGSIGHMIDFDTAGPFTAGEMRKQASTIPTTLSGNFVFGVASAQNSNTGSKFGAVGILDLDSSGGVDGGQLDFNLDGNLDLSIGCTDFSNCGPISVQSGDIYSVAANGRGTLAFTPSGISQVNTVIYVISSTDFFVLGSGDQSTDSALAGEALQQQATAFLPSTFSGNYVGATSQLSATAGDSRVDLILGNFTNGNISSITQYENDGGSVSAGTTISGTYAVSSAGRMLPNVGGTGPVIQFVDGTQGFDLGESGEVQFGSFQSQTSIASPSSTYAIGATNPETLNVADSEAVATFSGGNVSLTQDSNSPGGQQTGPLSPASFSVDSTGFAVVPSGCDPTTSGSCQFVFYVISPANAVGIDFTSSASSIQSADQ